MPRFKHVSPQNSEKASRGTYLLDGVAALQGASVARAGAAAAATSDDGRGCGGRKDGESKYSDGGDAREHFELSWNSAWRLR